MRSKLKVVNKRRFIISICVVLVLFIIIGILLFKYIISTPITKAQSAVIEQTVVNPCYKGEELGYLHTSVDEDWYCRTCGVYFGPRYGFSDGEVYLLAQLLCGCSDIDGDGEYDFVWDVINGKTVNYDQISLVLEVVMNRVESAEFPSTVAEVVMQGPPKYTRQFAVMPANAGKIPHPVAVTIVKEWCDAYDRWDRGVQSIPDDHLYFKADGKYMNISNISWR